MVVINQHCDAVPASAKGASCVDNSRIVTGCEVIDLDVELWTEREAKLERTTGYFVVPHLFVASGASTSHSTFLLLLKTSIST
jgi:hypothetical protein